MHKNKWLYVIFEVVFFFVLGGFASLIGFLVGYGRKPIALAAVGGFLLALIGVMITVASNPLTFFFGFVFGASQVFTQFLVALSFGVVFAVIGWFFGKNAKGGRH